MSEKSYATEFFNGRLYMNSLYYFWNEYPVKQAMKESSGEYILLWKY